MSNVITFPARPQPQESTEGLPFSDEAVDNVTEQLHGRLHNEIIEMMMLIGQGTEANGRYRLDLPWLAAICQSLIRRINEDLMGGTHDLESLQAIRDELIQDINDCFDHFKAKKGN